MKCKVIWVNFCPVFYFQFNHQHDLCFTFLRLQEFYESPCGKHRTKTFSIDEYIDWHLKKFGLFNYLDKWTGFNIPGVTVANFFRLFQFQLTRREKKIFNTLKKYKSWPNIYIGKQDYCVIAGCNHDSVTLQHELKHAAFYLDNEYAKEVQKEITQNKPKVLVNWLKASGYDQSSIVDEINAYTLTGWPEDCRVTKKMKQLKRALRKVDKKYGYSEQKNYSF